MIVIYLIVNRSSFFKNNLKELTHYYKTLNNEHGSIKIYFLKSKELLYIERNILEELDKCNRPKTELAIQENNKPFQMTLKHDEVKYICFKPI